MHMWRFIASRRNFTCWWKQNGPEQHTNQHSSTERVCSIDGAWVQRGVNTVYALGEEQVSDRATAELSLECLQHASRSPGRQTAPPKVMANRPPPSHLHLPLHKTILIPPSATHVYKVTATPALVLLPHQLSLLKKKRTTRIWSNKRQLLFLRLIMERLGLEQSPPSLIRFVSIYWMLKQRATFFWLPSCRIASSFDFLY